MSTRSGKRLRGSVYENTVKVDEEIVVKNERKSRSKRLKENSDDINISLKTRKRDNYVTYPTDDEVVDSDATVSTGNSDKPTKKSRKRALKEHDINITVQSNTDHLDSDIDTNKPIRITRRTRKFTENNPDEITINEEKDRVNEIAANGKIKKSMKRSKHETTEKENGKVQEYVSTKSKKQKNKNVKRTSLIIVEDKQLESNKSNTSVDSFYSTTGSPHKQTNDIQNMVISVKSHELSPKINTTFEKDIDSKSINSPRLTSEVIESPQKSEITVISKSFNRSTLRKNNRQKKGQVNKKTILDGHNVTLHVPGEENKVSYDVNNHNGYVKTDKHNTTFEEKSESPKDVTSKSLNSTFEKGQTTRVSEIKLLDTTYEKEDSSNKKLTNEKLSFISLDNSENVTNTTYSNSAENSRISITSDESMPGNVISTTPVLIESSMDSLITNDSLKLSRTPSPKNTMLTVPTPLRREGTFTKDGPESENDTLKAKMETDTPKARKRTDASITLVEKTPTRQLLVASPGFTPFPSSLNASQQNRKSVLNLTHSTEKPERKSSVTELPPRMTRVMFCSPVDIPIIGTDKKTRLIKSSLKGSNKTFMFEENSPASGRKRSRTHGAETAVAKRKRLTEDMQQAVDRLSRPRTSSANAKLVQSTTPSKTTVTPSKLKTAECRPVRSKLPNFAALHQRQFHKMESLDECQERKAKRAKQLLTPIGSLAVLERSSPKGLTTDTSRILKETTRKFDTPTKKFNTSTKTIDTSTKTIDSSTKTIDSSTKSIDTSTKTIDTSTKTIDSSTKTIDSSTKSIDSSTKTIDSSTKSIDTSTKTILLTKTIKTTTIEPLKRGYTRFGFKLNLDINPFSIPSKTQEVQKPPGLKREGTLPSLTGATSLRKEVAKQTVMREKSFTSLSDKRDMMNRTENRTVIKGVRTNRRFELQMRMRNVNS